ncbi:GIY-YIG nuclease family protein [Mesorhizobium muleiense]|uniref:GIY-YIG nuclease family protein n=1 Tax=Mesorhizobium muleiense TaxID=1004279 RepID=UPI003AFAF079
MLTREEVEFLSGHGLSINDVFDLQGSSPSSRRDQAKAFGKTILLGQPCSKKGHRLRLLAGHCFQCRPAGPGFQKRHSKPARVYIAWSQRLGLVKVGSSEDCSERENRLNIEVLGGAQDWQMIFHADASEAGRLEFAAHRTLSKYRRDITYRKGGPTNQISRECFNCSALRALKAIIDAASAEKLHITAHWRASWFQWQPPR